MMTRVVLMLLLMLPACDGGSSGTPTAPSLPDPPAPEKSDIEVTRLTMDVEVVSQVPTRVAVTSKIRVKESAGVAATFSRAQLEVFENEQRIINSRMPIAGDQAVPANSTTRWTITWLVEVNPRRDPDEVRTTYVFRDEKSNKIEITLVDDQTVGRGLKDSPLGTELFR